MRAASRSSARVWEAITARPHAGRALGHGGRADGLGEHAVLERVLDDPAGELGVADHQRHHVCGRAGHLEALAGQAVAQRLGVGPQPLDPARLLLDSSSAAIAAATATGGSAVECSSVRALWTRKRAVTWSQQANPP